MIEQNLRPNLRRLALLFTVATIASLSLGTLQLWNPAATAMGMMQVRNRNHEADGTPVAAADAPSDRRDGDPLDGDPLDGEVAIADPNPPADQEQLAIVRSARPSAEPETIPAYDDDATTQWIPDGDAGQTWLWFDLGDERRLREVRWLAAGAGTVEVSVSNDRRRWRAVDRVDTEETWQGTTLRDDARYVRLELLAENGELPAIAEVAVYGPQSGSVTAAQNAAGGGRERNRQRANRTNGDRESRRNSANQNAERRGNGTQAGETRGDGRVRVSAQAGETGCTGDRERCQARAGEVSIEEDCAQDGTCTIDVRADGGAATCDTAGGDESRAGDGAGRRAGDGGRCEAVADGGAVTIGAVGS